MIEQLVLALLIWASVLPIILIFKEKKANLKLYLSFAVIFHLIYVFLLFLPTVYPALSFSNSTMNWVGKGLTILFSLLFYFAVAHYFKNHDYIRALPAKDKLKKVLIIGTTTLAVMCVLTVLFSNGKPINLEKIAYQLSMPGLDEELWRGILLGLLMVPLKKSRFRLGHPALWSVTIIFAFGHALHFQNGQLEFALDVLIITGTLGYILGWMTIRSQSILPALIFHNLINCSTNLIEMTVL